MTTFQFTPYFEHEVLRKRPYLRREWCVSVVQHPMRVEREEDNRFRSGVLSQSSELDTFES